MSRVKANVLNNRFASTSFLSSAYASHNFEVSGQRYPQASANGYAQAAEEVIKYSRGKMDCKKELNMTMTHFSTDWTASTTAARESQLNGKLMYVFDAERVGSHDQSGLRLEPGSCQLNLVQNFVSETEVTIAWLYDRYVTVSDGQILIDY